jgi:hypothetical protein
MDTLDNIHNGANAGAAAAAAMNASAPSNNDALLSQKLPNHMMDRTLPPAAATAANQHHPVAEFLYQVRKIEVWKSLCSSFCTRCEHAFAGQMFESEKHLRGRGASMWRAQIVFPLCRRNAWHQATTTRT